MDQNNLLDSIKRATETKLSGDFVIELLKCCFSSKKILELCKVHLKYHYLQNEAQKKILKFIIDSYEVSNIIPTIGIVGQSFAGDNDAIALLAKIKKVDVHNDAYELILTNFEEFIKKSRFIALYSKVGELFNQGKQDQAIDLLADESEKIANFKLRDTYYTRIFADFEKRQIERKEFKDNVISGYCIWGINELDDKIGGLQYGRNHLIMARSGGGKSTMMKWVGLANARLGKRVLHFQAEGTLKECNDAYDAGWTGTAIDDIEIGNISSVQQAKIRKAQKDILSNGGDIIVYAAEQFDSLSVEDTREIALDVEKIHGKIDLIIWDYLPKFNVLGRFSGEHAERRRRLAIGDKMTNLCIELNCAGLSAVQAEDVKAADYNKPDFVLRRGNTSENKSQVEPFSVFITINQTDEEYEAGMARLWVDKLRKRRRPSQPIKIYQALDRARFYNSAETLKHFYQK